MDLSKFFRLLLVTLLLLTMFFIYELQKSDRDNRRYMNSRSFQEGEYC